MSRAGTIFALSSGRPPAAIAVVRVSGPQAGTSVEALIGRLPKPRYAAFATLRDPTTGEPLDQAVVLWFPAGSSETGEDVAEFQLHGGRAVIAATLAVLGRLPGLRPAEAGEFTRRAFENGRMDLTAVEGLADLIGAETEAQRRQAVRQAQGVLGKQVAAWRTRLIEALALVEAGLDFPDEGDVPTDLMTPALRIVGTLRDEMSAALAASSGGERLREGLTIAVAGPPNAGKSTLFNALAGRDVAIVSPYPGTTRDVLEVHLDLDGYPITVIDTAGLRDSADPVEAEGIRRARARAAAADLVLRVSDVRDFGAARTEASDGPADQSGATRTWSVLNKSDLVIADIAGAQTHIIDVPDPKVYLISALTGTGIAGLLADVTAFARTALSGTESALVTRARHRHELEFCVHCFEDVMNINSFDELVAEGLRSATQALGRVAGRVDVEDVLDVIFRDFCIGK